MSHPPALWYRSRPAFHPDPHRYTDYCLHSNCEPTHPAMRMRADAGGTRVAAGFSGWPSSSGQQKVLEAVFRLRMQSASSADHPLPTPEPDGGDVEASPLSGAAAQQVWTTRGQRPGCCGRSDHAQAGLLRCLRPPLVTAPQVLRGRWRRAGCDVCLASVCCPARRA